MTDNSLEEDYLVKKHNIDTTPEQFKEKSSFPEREYMTDEELNKIQQKLSAQETLKWDQTNFSPPEDCACNYTTNPDGTDPQGVMCMKHVLSHEQKIKSQFRKDLEKWKCPPHEKMGECVPWHAVEDALNNPGLFEK